MLSTDKNRETMIAECVQEDMDAYLSLCNEFEVEHLDYDNSGYAALLKKMPIDRLTQHYLAVFTGWRD
jgi:hypothetical protein